MYITEEINESDHKDVLCGILCHQFTKHFVSLFVETCIGSGRLILGADRLVLDVKTRETYG